MSIDTYYTVPPGSRFSKETVAFKKYKSFSEVPLDEVTKYQVLIKGATDKKYFFVDFLDAVAFYRDRAFTEEFIWLMDDNMTVAESENQPEFLDVSCDDGRKSS